MKETNNYWVDANGNKWNKTVYTKEQAKKNSKTLINCYVCYNCSCCSYCYNCSECSDCSYCSYCSKCSYCSNCSDCYNCSECSDCSCCSKFDENPQRITSKKIGSRDSQTTYYFTEKHEQIVCGCFTGTLQEFEEIVKLIHKDNEYAKQYLQFIEKIKQYKQ